LPSDGIEEQFCESYAVAETHGVVVGLIGVERYGRLGLLRSAVTDEAWRGRGVGRALTEDRITWGRSQGLTALYLLTTTASGFFKRFGFRPIERALVPDKIQRSVEFSSACPTSALVMVLPLWGLETRGMG
jgi:amino-acid N-acetyltransferase